MNIMFVCHGNICRSPMAEFIFLDEIKKQGLDKKYNVASSATSFEEIGNDMYPPAKDVLRKHNVPFSKRAATRFTVQDYNNYDFVIVMEDYNKKNLIRIVGCDCKMKIRRLLDFTDCPNDVKDPWYSGDFDSTYLDIKKGVLALIKWLEAL